jgi:hypothetical protein
MHEVALLALVGSEAQMNARNDSDTLRKRLSLVVFVVAAIAMPRRSDAQEQTTPRSSLSHHDNAAGQNPPYTAPTKGHLRR